MAKSILPASVETRLKAQRTLWHRLAMREREEQALQPAPFITISRQYGCMAHVLAERLAERLKVDYPEWNFTIYDREMLEALSARDDVASEAINSLSERTRGAVEDWIGHLLAERPPEIRVFKRMATAFCSIAALGQAILVGRGGAAITRNVPRGIHVRLIAPMSWRIENLRNYPERADQANAEAVKRADRERESFLKKYLGVDGNDPELYHLIINNQLLSIEEQVELIARLVQHRCAA